MGRQVRFVFSDDDVAQLQQHLIDVGAAFIPARSELPEIKPQADLAAPVEMAGLTSDIIRASDLARARRIWIPTPLAEPPHPGYWGLDRTSVHVIDYTRGPRQPLEYGRLHFDTVELRGGQLLSIDGAFIKWADEILRWVRRTFRYDRAGSYDVGRASTAGPPGDIRGH